MKKYVHNDASVPAVPPLAFARSEIGRRLADAMQAGSPSQRRLAEFVLRNPLRFAAWSIEDVARESGVSAPTISRFARELGHAGFAEFRAAIAGTLHAVVQSVEKLRDRMDEGAPGTPWHEAPAANLALAGQGITAAQIAAVVRHIAAARTVHVMGFGMSAHVAALLTLGIQPYHPQVVNVVEFGGTEVAAGRLATIGPDDLLFAITFPRYASDVMHLTRYARDRKARVVGLTDSVASPLARYCDEVLLAPSAHPVLSSSAVAAVAVVEAVSAALMLSDRENIDRAARLTEAISSYLHQTDTNGG